jgi:hypothetical protein
MPRHAIVRTAPLPGGTPFQIVANDYRVALMFSPPPPRAGAGAANAQYTVSTDPGVTPGAGLNLAPTTGPLLITEEVHGDAVQKSWWVVSPTAMTIGFLEVLRGS